MRRVLGERALVWWRLAIVLAAVVPLGILAGTAWLTYEDAGREAQRKLDDIARRAEEHAARVMERNDVVMQEMLRLLRDDDDAAVRAREAELHDVATAILLRFPDMRSLSVWGREGGLLVSSLFFPVPHAIQRVDWARGLLVDYASGERLFRVTKLRQAAGEAAGEVELAFSASYFSEAFRRLTEGQSGRSIALISGEGFVFGHWPSTLLGRTRLEEGSGLLREILAGKAHGALANGVFAVDDAHFAAFRKVRNHPLFVATVERSDSVFAGWRREMLGLGAILLPITLALVLAAGLVLRRTRREIEARRRLSEESEQRRLAEESLRHAQRLDALGQLAAGLAHDFNNLLAIVASSAELLAKSVPGVARRPELASIERAAQRGTRLTRRLLASFRRQPPKAEVICAGEALVEMGEILRTTAGGGVILNIAVQPGLPAMEVDAAELEIALINLVANARDALRGAGRIDIEARLATYEEGRAPGAPGPLVIAVSDNGEGMSPDTLRHAFEPFFTTKPAGSGTGLGLSQVAAFCEQSAGTVNVRSALHVGTTVSMVLPALERAAQAPAPLCARVILVQDGASSPLAVMLKRHGCVVTAVASPLDAERLIVTERGHFDAVLAPASPDGVEAAGWIGRLRRRKPDVPVLLIGAGGTPAGEEVMAALSRAISAHRPAASVH
jgi:two-component system NtrC family sensor kinase